MSQPTRFVESMYSNPNPVAYIHSMHISYQLAPPHEYIGRIERNNWTTQDKLSCDLAISSAKSKLWLYVFGDAISKLNIIPRQHLSWKMSYFKWFGTRMISIINHYYYKVIQDSKGRRRSL